MFPNDLESVLLIRVLILHKIDVAKCTLAQQIYLLEHAYIHLPRTASAAPSCWPGIKLLLHFFVRTLDLLQQILFEVLRTREHILILKHHVHGLLVIAITPRARQLFLFEIYEE